jgi:hypothetical protein
LREISGMATVGRALYVINDKAPPLIFRLDASCRVVGTINLGLGVRDTEDLAATRDGALWVGDIGGNNLRRTSVRVFRRLRSGLVQSFQLHYPDGAHDAEAMLISRTGQLLVVTKRPDGRSGVYAATFPLKGVSSLRLVARLDVASLRPRRRGSLCVTGASVAPSGNHFVLRTYTHAYEWDAPDGDLIRALRGRAPRAIPLASTRQGEAITYAGHDGSLLTASEKLPAPVHVVSIRRR